MISEGNLKSGCYMGSGYIYRLRSIKISYWEFWNALQFELSLFRGSLWEWFHWSCVSVVLMWIVTIPK